MESLVKPEIGAKGDGGNGVLYRLNGDIPILNIYTYYVHYNIIKLPN